MSEIIRQKYISNTLRNALTSKYVFDTIISMRYTFKDFKTEYPDDEACLKQSLLIGMAILVLNAV